MNSLIMQELKKILKSKLVWSFVIIFIILNLINIYSTYGKVYNYAKESNNSQSKVYDVIDGKVMHEKQDYINDEIKNTQKLITDGFGNEKGRYSQTIYDENMIMTIIQQEMDYAYNYGTNNDELVKKAQDNVQFYTKSNSPYDKEYNQKIVDDYKDREIENFYDTEGFSKYIDYNFSTLLVMLLLILGLVPVFSKEKQGGMYQIINTSLKGRKSVTSAKMVASCIYAFIFELIFTIVDLLSFMFIYGLYGAQNPLYSIKKFIYSPLSINIFQYILMAFGLKLIFFLMFTAFILLLSSLFSDNVLQLVISISFAGLFLFANRIFINSTGTNISDFNPGLLLSSSKLFTQYNVIKLFGHPVYTLMVVIIITTALFVIFSVLTKLVNNRYMNKNINIFSSVYSKLKEMMGVS